MYNRDPQSGFIALMSAIIISAVLMTVTFSLSYDGFLARFNLLDGANKERSLNVAEACVNIAINKLIENMAYPGNETESVGDDSCRILPIETSGTESSQKKIIKTTADLGQSRTNLKVTVNIEALLLPSKRKGPVCADTVMMLDRTGSMRPGDLANERLAAKSLLELYSEVVPNPKVGAGHFGYDPGEPDAQILASGQLTKNYGDDDLGDDTDGDLYNAVEKATTSTDSNTNIGYAITVSYDELMSVRATPGNKKILILISDGMANLPWVDPIGAARDAAALAKSKGIEIFTIHFGEDPDGLDGQELLAELATDSADDQPSAFDENEDGDHFYISPTASDMKNIFLEVGKAACPLVLSPSGITKSLEIDSWEEVPSF